MTSARKNAILLFALLTSAYFAVFVRLARLTDFADFGGDTWEYQSMGVNLARGHGIQKFGGLEPFETYRFERPDSLPPYYGKFFSSPGWNNFYRTPAYPFFLGVVYKLFGVSPRIAKGLQLLMLVIIAASLPFVGQHYWGQAGFIGGLLSGPLYLATNYRLAETILTEPLATFAVFLVLAALVAQERWPGIKTDSMLGATLGFALLVRPSLVFLPILVAATMVRRAVVLRDSREAKHVAVAVAFTLVTILPWSLFATMRSGRPIVLATQGTYQLLSDNNELCTDGSFHPEWRDMQDSFYNRDGIAEDRVVTKVLNFYGQHPGLFLPILLQKVLLGFVPLPFFWAATLFMIVDRIGSRVVERVRSRDLRVSLLSALLAISALACVPIWWIGGDVSAVRGWMFRGDTAMKVLGVLGAGAVLAGLLGRRGGAMRVPASCWAISGSFLLVTLVFHAEADGRYTAPMNFVLVLLSCVGAVRVLSRNLERMASCAQDLPTAGWRNGPGGAGERWRD